MCHPNGQVLRVQNSLDKDLFFCKFSLNMGGFAKKRQNIVKNG